jgi:SNF2 family DNA or RNA helicase
MQIIDNKALLLTLRDTTPILTTIPDSKSVSDTEVLVKWDVPQVHRLRTFNIKAPSPIEGRYDWPGRYAPYDHQRKTAAFLTNHKRAFCFNEQGTGKTGSAIWAADFLMKRGLVKRVLVVCPVSIMDSAWRADLFTFAMHRTVDIAYGSAAKRKKIVESGAEFIIINYDGLQVIEDEIRDGGFDLIIVDEASHYKNAQTKRWKCLSRLVGEDTWLWLMTGTPAAQSPTDAFGIAKLVNPKGVPRYFSSFRDMVMFKQGLYKWIAKDTAVDTVHQVLQPAIRFTKDECLDLPDLVYAKRRVELTPQQKLYYEKLRKEMLFEAADEEVTAINAAVKSNKLLQISCGAVYTDEGNTLEFDIKNRYSVLREVIDETANKVLIFVPFQHTIGILSAALTKDGITNEIISGKVKPGDRTKIFSDFQTKKDPRVLVIQPQAAAHGVTLTAADTIVWWGPTPSLETYAQANARIHRAGQKHKCTVVQLVGSGMEHRIYKLLDEKIDVHSKIVDLYADLLD